MQIYQNQTKKKFLLLYNAVEWPTEKMCAKNQIFKNGYLFGDDLF